MAGAAGAGGVACLHLRPSETVALFLIERPWMALFGNFIRNNNADTAAALSQPPAPAALLLSRLPEHVLLNCLLLLPAAGLAAAACTCRNIRSLSRHPALWRRLCGEAWPAEKPQVLVALVNRYGSWRNLYLMHPRLRTDGVYVSRNTYVKNGVRDMSGAYNAVHVVLWFRYVRFYPDGSCLYTISSEKVAVVSKLLVHGRPSKSSASMIYVGRYEVADHRVTMEIRYPGNRPTTVKSELRVRSTCPGAFNRIDITSLSSTLEGGEGGETQDHSRGLSTYVFVNNYDTATSVLNLPIDKMDYYFPG